jgi:phosphonate transport system ATP-binding protein
MLLKVKNLEKTYNKGVTALAGVSFGADSGELIAIIGPSGSGKSTLLRCINRMIEPSAGEILIKKLDVRALGKKELRELRSRIGMIFQHYNLVNRLSVLENVLHGLLGRMSSIDGVFSRYSHEAKKNALEILERLGLNDQAYKRCDELSGGQKQRVGIARALIQHPELILCDEPIASLDPSSAKVIMDYLKRISREFDIAVIVNLHQVEVAKKYADRIIGLNSGKIIYEGKPSDLGRKDVYRIYGSDDGGLIGD